MNVFDVVQKFKNNANVIDVKKRHQGTAEMQKRILNYIVISFQYFIFNWPHYVIDVQLIVFPLKFLNSFLTITDTTGRLNFYWYISCGCYLRRLPKSEVKGNVNLCEYELYCHESRERIINVHAGNIFKTRVFLIILFVTFYVLLAGPCRQEMENKNHFLFIFRILNFTEVVHLQIT